MWGHATPVMLFALSLISDFSSTQVMQTLVVDIIMIATVIPGELIPGAAAGAGAGCWGLWVVGAVGGAWGLLPLVALA
jgi:bacteriorhodopsin